ncbi:hypothetical protein [Mucilaginibacter sp. PAMB04168]|uniref:hypothetical protein n=1 Tax=Mucilaginibacter sp. PAMB04168 TaxID=3138567 RepID=UPI0031F670E6
MKQFSFVFLAALLVVSSAFAPVAEPVFPELAQSFKLLKKSNAVTYDRQDVLGGIQQLGITTRARKQPVIVEFLGDDGFSAPVAMAVLKAALASYGINDVKIVLAGSATSAKVAPALAKLGFKVNGNEIKYNDQGGSVTLETTASNPQVIHVLAQESSASLLASKDKFAVKLQYAPLAADATNEQYEAQAKLVTAEMLFAASKFKENWK